jgi:hypothetical protein
MGKVFRMGESKFGAPQGLYTAEFLGVDDRTAREGDQSPKNSCGRMLSQLTGGAIAKDQDVDIGPYVGRLYQVMVEANSTGNGTRVGTVMPLANGAAPSPPTIQAMYDPLTSMANDKAAARKPAPPKPAAPPPPAGGEELARKYWVTWHGETIEMTGAQIHEELKRSNLDAKTLPVMAHDQAGGWKTAADFLLEIPF